MCMSSVPACPFAQPAHQRVFPSDGSPNLAGASLQSAHALLTTSTAPFFSFAQTPHQRFFRYLCVSAKVPAVLREAQAALAAQECVVVGLQSTGESCTLEAVQVHSY